MAENSLEIVAAAPEALELQSLATEDLHDRLGTTIGMTEAAIRTVAALWRELVRRGEDMGRYRFSLSRFMLPVAEGRLLPGVVVKLSGQQRALDRIAELPIKDQARILAGEPIKVYRGDGRVHEAPVEDLTFSEVALAIQDGRIRALDEQRMAHERSRRAKMPARRGRMPMVTVTDKATVRIGKSEVPIERVLAALRAAKVID